MINLGNQITNTINSTVTSATASVKQAAASLSGLASQVGSGGNILNAVTGVASTIGNLGMSLSSALTGGIQSLAGSFSSSFATVAPPAMPSITPQQAMAINGDVGNFAFPSDIGDYYAMFTFYEYIRPVAIQPSSKKITSTIILPIPATLVEQFSMQYQQIEMGQIVNTVQDAVSTKGANLKDAVTTGSGAADLGAAIALPAGAKGVEALFGAGIGADAMNAAQQSVGMAPNPHVGLLFKGVNLRAPHQLEYNLAPRDPSESARLRDIIRQLKIRMHPTVGTVNLMFEYPDLCDISIRRPAAADGTQVELYTFKPCFLESMSVNYAPNGAPTFFKGTREPTNVVLVMSFKEAEIFTRKDFA